MSATDRETVRVLFFARYAELIGREEMEVELPHPPTVAELVRTIRATIPGAIDLPQQPLTAVNLKHAAPNAPLRAGDEVALLPPLAGGRPCG